MKGENIVSNPLEKEAHLTPFLQNDNEYTETISQIENLLKVGKGNIRTEDLMHYSHLAKKAQSYEKEIYVIDVPTTLEGLLEWKMFELKLKQRDLAAKLHISDAKLSLIMNGKQKPDVKLLKTIYKELAIDGNVLINVL